MRSPFEVADQHQTAKPKARQRRPFVGHPCTRQCRARYRQPKAPRSSGRSFPFAGTVGPCSFGPSHVSLEDSTSGSACRATDGVRSLHAIPPRVIAEAGIPTEETRRDWRGEDDWRGQRPPKGNVPSHLQKKRPPVRAPHGPVNRAARRARRDLSLRTRAPKGAASAAVGREGCMAERRARRFHGLPNTSVSRTPSLGNEARPPRRSNGSADHGEEGATKRRSRLDGAVIILSEHERAESGPSATDTPRQGPAVRAEVRLPGNRSREPSCIRTDRSNDSRRSGELASAQSSARRYRRRSGHSGRKARRDARTAESMGSHYGCRRSSVVC